MTTNSPRRGERFFQALIEKYLDLIMVLDADGSVRYLNFPGETVLGYNTEDWIGKNIQDYTHPGDIHIIRSILHPDNPYWPDSPITEIRFRHSDGSWYSYETTSRNLLNDADVAGIILVLHDITDHRCARQALRLSENRFRDMFMRHWAVMLLISPKTGQILNANRAAEKFYGYSHEVLCNMKITEINQLPPERVDREMQVATHEERNYFIFPHRLANGEIRTVEVHSSPIDYSGETILFSIVHDITERKMAEEALHQAIMYNRNLFEVSLDPLVTIDLNGRISDVNHATEIITGYSRQHLIGTDFTLYFTDPERAQAGYQQAFNTGHVRDYELELKHRDGDVSSVLYNASIYRNESGDVIGVFASARDISRRKQAEEAIQALSSQLLEAQENERRNIARELHDEIGQIFTTVKTNLQTIQLLPHPQALEPFLNESIATVDNALGQVRDLSLDLRPSLLDDFGLIPALEWYLNRQGERSFLKIDFTADPADMRLQPALETACFRIVQAAVTNVIRHAKAKHVRVTLRLFQDRGGDTYENVGLLLVIHDDGVGFDVDATLERARRGTSFGLLGMIERARLVGGKMDIHSIPMHGSKIRVYFPLVITAAQPTLLCIEGKPNGFNPRHSG